MKERFKSVDLFGQQVGLTWQGDDQYKTSVGASLSWLIMLVMIAYTIFRLYFMVNRLNPNISKTSLIRDPNEDSPFSP